MSTQPGHRHANANRPNVVWLNMDQHPLANREPVSSTLPLQARMACEGMRFGRAYTVLPICSPARASMMTGVYPHAHGLTENDGRFGGRDRIEPDEWMVSRAFEAAGYELAWFGKWHLNNDVDAAGYGFAGYSECGYGYPYAAERYREYCERHDLGLPRATVDIVGESGIPRGTTLALSALANWPDFEAGALRFDGPARWHEAWFVADEAAGFIDAHAGEPFFLRVDPWGPHPPYCVAPPFTEQFDTNDLRPANFWSDLAGRPPHHRAYRDEWQILGLDETGWRRLAARSMQQAALVEVALLNVLDALDRNGLSERTIVLVTADHGDAVASNGGTANKGGLLVEETVRIPMLVRGPGIPTGTRSETLATNVDIAPTLLTLAGLEVPVDLHGLDLTPAWNEAHAHAARGVLLQHNGLHVPLAQRGWVQGDWKLVLQEDGFLELYNLKNDPCEMRNLAEQGRYASVRGKLLDALSRDMERLGDEAASILSHANS